MFRYICTLAFALGTLAGTLTAQASGDAITPGRTIRVHQGASASFTGVVVSATPDTLTLATADQGKVVLLRSTVTGIDVQNGTRSNAGRGAVKGLIIGGGIGLVLGAASAAAQSESDFLYVDPGQLILSSTLGGAMLGGAIGALVGATSHTPRWVPIVSPTAPAQPDGTTGKGVALGMNLRF